MKKISLRTIIISLVSLLVLGIIAFFPLPYVLEMPGSAEKVEDFITIEGVNEKKEGSFRVMTVLSQQATPLLALQTLLPHVEMIPKEKVYGTTPSKEYNKIQEYYMQQARNAAISVAYKAAGKTVEAEFLGVYVMTVVPESDFKEKIQVGDIVTKVDGESFSSAQEMIQAISAKKIGDPVTIEINRNQEMIEKTGVLVENPDTGKPMLGIQLVTHSKLYESPKVDFDPHGVSGPSAGLMFTLEIYNQLTDKNLKQGRIVAGTGTMNEKGEVGRIGGVDKKLVAAVRAGATIFLAPDDEITDEMREKNPNILSNYEEAKRTAEKIKSNIQVYPVKKFEDAVKILEK